MTTQQEVYFSMALKVKNFAAKNTGVINGVQGAAAQVTQLNNLITQLITADTGSSADLTGFAMDKANKRSTLENLCIKFSNAMAALAVNTNDVVLQKRADFVSSFWYRASEDELITQATIVKNLATANATALVPYGVAAADQTTFATALTTFTDAISNPTLAIDQRKVDTERIPEIIDQIRTLFDTKLDVLMRLLELSNPTAYQLYKLARAQDQRSSAMAPTVVQSVAPNSAKTLHTATVYDADAFYTVQNMGNEAVYFSLSNEVDTEGNDAVLLNTGETRSRLAENLSATGLYFTVKNPSAAPVEVKLWVE